MIRKIAAFVTNLLEIIDFPGYTYLNLWSLCLLIVSIWICVATKSIPSAVAAIFSSIVIAYSANSIGNKFISKNSNDTTKERKSNDNDSSSSK